MHAWAARAAAAVRCLDQAAPRAMLLAKLLAVLLQPGCNQVKLACTWRGMKSTHLGREDFFRFDIALASSVYCGPLHHL